MALLVALCSTTLHLKHQNAPVMQPYWQAYTSRNGWIRFNLYDTALSQVNLIIYPLCITQTKDVNKSIYNSYHLCSLDFILFVLTCQRNYQHLFVMCRHLPGNLKSTAILWIRFLSTWLEFPLPSVKCTGIYSHRYDMTTLQSHPVIRHNLRASSI